MKEHGKKIIALIVCACLIASSSSVQSFAGIFTFDSEETVTDTIEKVSGEVQQLYEDVDLESINDTEYGTKTLLVQLADQETETFPISIGARQIIAVTDGVFALSFETEDEAAQAYDTLSTSDLVASIEKDMIVQTESIIEVTNTGETEGTTASGDATENNSPIRIAVIDSGIDQTNTSLMDITEDSGINLSETGEEGSTQDDNGHGTGIANIILETSSTYGCSNISLIPIKVLNENGVGTVLSLYLGMKAAIDQDVDIINLSLSTKTESPLIEQAVNEAVEKGILVVGAAGNNGEDVSSYAPGNIDSAIVVGAVSGANALSKYSNTGETIDYTAYGKADTIGLNEDAVSMEGTSVSTAVVTARIAKLLEDNPAYTQEEIEAQLQTDAIDCGEEGWDELFGYGRIGNIPESAGDDMEATVTPDETVVGAAFYDPNQTKTGYHVVATGSFPCAHSETKAYHVGVNPTGATINPSYDQLQAGMYNTGIPGTFSILTTSENYGMLDETVSHYGVYFNTQWGNVWLAGPYSCYHEAPNAYLGNNAGYVYFNSSWSYCGYTGIYYLVKNGHNALYCSRYPTTNGDIEEKVWTYTHTVTVYNFEPNTYTINYNGNGATSGNTVSSGHTYDTAKKLSSNGYKRTGYKFKGWSTSASGGVVYTDQQSVLNLTATNNGSVTLYAVWEKSKPPTIIRATNVQDYNRGFWTYAYVQNNGDGISKVAFPIWSNLNGQDDLFSNWSTTALGTAGNYTINGKTYNYRYYTNASKHNYEYGKHSVHIYAYDNYLGYAIYTTSFQYKFDVTFDATGGTIEENGTDKESITKTLTYGTAYGTLPEPTRAGYDFLGWYTQAEGGTRITAATIFQNGGDLTVYAQWETRYDVAYLGNQEESGSDFIDNQSGADYTKRDGTTDIITLSESQSNGTDLFTKNKVVSFTDIETGTDIEETVTGTIVGWSFYNDVAASETDRYYNLGQTFLSSEFYSLADGIENVITSGAPKPEFNADYQLSSAEIPVINLYAVWDYGPKIEAYDLYVSLEDAQNGTIIEDYLLNQAIATDEELVTAENDTGKMNNGTDTENHTSFTIPDYQETDFTSFVNSGSVTETYQAVDSVGNVTNYKITVYVIDTKGIEEMENSKRAYTRFISATYLNADYENGGLESNSIWKLNEEYQEVLEEAISNQESETAVETYQFTREQIIEMQEYVSEHGIGNVYEDDALKRFSEQFMGK